MINRRDLLRMGFCAGAGLLARPRDLLVHAAVAQSGMTMPSATPQVAAGAASVSAPPSIKLASYVTPLSHPPVIRPQSGGVVPIRMVPFRHQAHRDLQPATMWGYNGMWPGPTFEVRKGQPFSIKWSNQLPTRHFLPIDNTIHGSEENVPEVRTVTHVHGAQVLPESDGYPDAWVTADGRSGSVAPANPAH